MQTAVNLRDYQRECLAAIFNRYQEGVRRQLMCLPTGTGKTVIFAQFPPCGTNSKFRLIDFRCLASL